MTIVHFLTRPGTYRMLEVGETIRNGDLCAIRVGELHEAWIFTGSAGLRVTESFASEYFREVDPLIAAMIEARDNK